MKKSRIILKVDLGNGIQRDWVSFEILTPDTESLNFWRHISELISILQIENKKISEDWKNTRVINN